jgi:hypothetical protein
MVAVKMRDKDFRDARGRDVGEDHLPLRALARVEQKSLAVPAQKIPVVIALARRHLAARPERDKSSCRHKVYFRADFRKIFRASKRAIKNIIIPVTKSATKTAGAVTTRPSPGNKTLPPPLRQAVKIKTKSIKIQPVKSAEKKKNALDRYFIFKLQLFY